MLVDDTASTVPPSPLPDSVLGDELPAPPTHQLAQQHQYSQVLPLHLSTLNNISHNDLSITTLMKNKLGNNTDAQQQQYLTLSPLCSFSSFQQQQQPNQKKIIINTKNLNGKNNLAVYCNPLMYSNNGNKKDNNSVKEETKIQIDKFNNSTNTYSIF